MQRGHLRVPVQHLTEEPLRLEMQCPASAVGLEGFLGDIEVVADIRRIGQRALLHCTVRGVAASVCDRCAEPFDGTFTAEYEQWYAFDAHGVPDEDDSQEAVVISGDEREVVIDEDVRENMLIAMPMKRLCREDCRGLCATCGHNRNLEPCACEEESDNPLWAGLRDINR